MNKRLSLAVVFLVALTALTVVPAFAQDRIVIDMWQIFSDQRRTWLDERAVEFEALYPQYDIEVRNFDGYEALIDQYTLTVDADGAPTADSPEIPMIFEIGTQFARDSGWFEPIAEAIGDRTDVLGQAVDFSDIIAPIVSYYTVDGAWTSMPWASSSPILYANMEMLVEAGIVQSVDDVDALPETWQELEAACQTIIDSGAVDNCVTWPNHGWFFEQWVAQQNTALVNNENGRTERATEVNLTSDAALNVAEWWQSMEDRGFYVYTGVQRDWAGTEQALHAGRVPFIITSSAGVRGITDTGVQNGITIRTSRMPYDAEVGWTGNIIGGGSLWLTRDLDEATKDGALAWMLYIINTENSATWHQSSGYLVLRQSGFDLLTEQGWFDENPNFRTADEQIATSTVTSATSGALFGTFIPTRNLVTQAIEDLMLQGGDAAQVMAEAQEAANRLLEEYNLLYVQ